MIKLNETCDHKFIFKRYFGGYSKIDGQPLNGVELHCKLCDGTVLENYEKAMKILGKEKGEFED
jgi:hypothetical protein